MLELNVDDEEDDDDDDVDDVDDVDDDDDVDDVDDVDDDDDDDDDDVILLVQSNLFNLGTRFFKILERFLFSFHIFFFFLFLPYRTTLSINSILSSIS